MSHLGWQAGKAHKQASETVQGRRKPKLQKSASESTGEQNQSSKKNPSQEIQDRKLELRQLRIPDIPSVREKSMPSAVNVRPKYSRNSRKDANPDLSRCRMQQSPEPTGRLVFRVHELTGWQISSPGTSTEVRAARTRRHTLGQANHARGLWMLTMSLPGPIWGYTAVYP